MRQVFQSLRINIILHGVTCNAVQTGWIKHAILIFSGIYIKTLTDESYTSPLIFSWSKVAQMIGEILLRLLIQFVYLYEKRRSF